MEALQDIISLILSEEEVHGLTGYKRPADQLAELRRQGFFRARRSPRTGTIILERAHFDAVCAGPAAIKVGPKVKAPVVQLLRTV